MGDSQLSGMANAASCAKTEERALPMVEDSGLLTIGVVFIIGAFTSDVGPRFRDALLRQPTTFTHGP